MAAPDTRTGLESSSTEDSNVEADQLLHGPPSDRLNRICNSQADSNPEPKFLLTEHQRGGQLDVETETSRAELSGVKAFTNLIVLTFALTLNFSAFHSFQALQSSLNIAEGLGTTGLSVLYGTMVLTSLFFAQLTLVRYSYKWIMVISSLSYTAFMATGFYPAWSTVIPASLLIGFGFIWGNLFASLVFRRETENKSTSLHFCGSEFCSFGSQAVDDIQLPNAAKAFVSCAYGVQNVCLVVITFGVATTLCKFTIGKVSKFTGLYIIICISSIISLTVMVSLLLWQPSREGLPVVFVLAGLYGLASAGNEPLLIMLYSTLFKDSTTSALSSYRAMSSLGWAVSFGYSNWLCMRHKLYIVITMLSLSYLCLSVLFLRHRTMDNVCRKLTCTRLKRTDKRDDTDT
ncbi:protein unc-93 homolog A-like isoform X2 [Mya arenaria]|uniref:protein unc-93 homolog A-like isoform X2 n=1 Tax=Mya arenaria TaxID=6604 RepID=UPI0022E92047|nr:protein unc-93 homolog A-like isoform X2 [Mya arenaria]